MKKPKARSSTKANPTDAGKKHRTDQSRTDHGGTEGQGAKPPKPRHHRGLVAVGIIAAALLVLALIWDWNWFKGPIERRVEAKSGREFSIEGDLDVDFFPLSVQMGGVRLGNSDWSKRQPMFEATDIDFHVRFWPLLAGRVIIPRVSMTAPELVLERRSDGRNNWTFGDDDRDDASELPAIGDVDIDRGHLVFDDEPFETSLDVVIATTQPEADDARAPITATGSGRYRGEPFKLDAKVDSPLHLVATNRPYRIDARAIAGKTRAHVSGALISPLAFRDFDLAVELAGASMGDLYRLFGLGIPETPPYKLDGRLRRVGNSYGYRDLTGVVGKTDLAGEAEIDVGGDKPNLTADLKSRKVHLRDLAGFVNADPIDSGKTPTRGPGRILPAEAFDVERLDSMNANVKYQAGSVDTKLPLDNMRAHLVLQDRRLRFDPLAFGVAGGTMSGTLTLNARSKPATAAADISVKGVELPKLFERFEVGRNSVGRIGGRLKVDGQGNSIADVLASADGELGLAMGTGRVSNLLLEFAGIDIAESLRFMLGGDQTVQIRCAYADFSLKAGVGTARSLAVDTTDTIINGEGNVDFRDESLNLTLHPLPKDMSLIALRTPLIVGGSFADPSFRPEVGRMLLRAAVAAALASIAPPVALIALVELGPGEDGNCAQGLARANEVDGK